MLCRYKGEFVEEGAAFALLQRRKRLRLEPTTEVRAMKVEDKVGAKVRLT